MSDSSRQFLLWVAIPYVSFTTFWVGHFWRYQTAQYRWTTRSTELFEQKLLRPGIILFHFALLTVLIGHVVGLLIPKSVTDWLGIDEHGYHTIAVILGSVSGLIAASGLALLVFRRAVNERVRRVTYCRDWFVIITLVVVVVTGLGNLIMIQWHGGGYDYRETISPWVRSIISFRPRPGLMDDAPLTFQVHAMAAMFLFAVWPFTRLVHAWSAPLSYLARPYLVVRRRDSLAR